MPINVIVASQKDIVRSGLRFLLNAQKDISVLGEAMDFQSTDCLVATLNPDISVVELALVAQAGSRDTEGIIRSWSCTGVIIFSQRQNREYVDQCVGAGARGYVLAELLGSEIVDAVRKVYGGGLYLSSRLAPEAGMKTRGVDGPRHSAT